MGDSEVIRILSLFVLLTLMCAIARQMSEMGVTGYDTYLYAEAFAEAFENAPKKGSPKENLLYGVPENTGSLDPSQVGTYGLGRPPQETTVDGVGSLSAQEYYEKDFAAHTMRTGNHIQRTNNYRQE
jgi:hypothetical protein